MGARAPAPGVDEAPRRRGVGRAGATEVTLEILDEEPYRRGVELPVVREPEPPSRGRPPRPRLQPEHEDRPVPALDGRAGDEPDDAAVARLRGVRSTVGGDARPGFAIEGVAELPVELPHDRRWAVADGAYGDERRRMLRRRQCG